MSSGYSAAEIAQATKLFKSARIPLFTSPTSLVWIIYEYFDTLEDEARYIWPGRLNKGKLLFFIIRYYTIALAIFDVAQIHSFAHFQPSLNTCVVMDAMIRVVGAISLWTVEIIMQLRIYALYECSKKVAIVNALLFVASMIGFLWILIHNGLGRAAVIHSAKALPIPGCPVVHTGIEWAQWVPATIFEGVLFAFALAKGVKTAFIRMKGGRNVNGVIYTVLLHDNVAYFFGVTALLVLNNLMVVGATRIPWFSYGPFHVAIGIMTCRMLMHLHKTVVKGRIAISYASVELSETISSSNANRRSNAYAFSSVNEDSIGTSQTLNFVHSGSDRAGIESAVGTVGSGTVRGSVEAASGSKDEKGKGSLFGMSWKRSKSRSQSSQSRKSRREKEKEAFFKKGNFAEPTDVMATTATMSWFASAGTEAGDDVEDWMRDENRIGEGLGGGRSRGAGDGP